MGRTWQARERESKGARELHNDGKGIRALFLSYDTVRPVVSVTGSTGTVNSAQDRLTSSQLFFSLALRFFSSLHPSSSSGSSSNRSASAEHRLRKKRGKQTKMSLSARTAGGGCS